MIFRWGEVDTYRALPQTAGLTMLGCAGVAAIILWFHAFQADRSGRQTGVARLTGDLVDQQDAAEVFDALDRWWSIAGPEAMQGDAARIRTVRKEALARLRLATLISERDERSAAWASQPPAWSERRR